MLPFTSTQFFDLFGIYNNAIWPIQVATYALAFLAMAMLLRPGVAADRFLSVTLALMWSWTGVAYHWFYFSAINFAAWVFGAAFVVQGAIFLSCGAIQNRLQFEYVRATRPALGVALIVYAGAIYPAIGMSLGHSYPNAPVFGITPCPVTIFTFGCLLLLRSPMRWWVVVIPVLWSLIGGTAAFLLDAPQDWLLLVSGVATTALLAKGRPPLLH